MRPMKLYEWKADTVFIDRSQEELMTGACFMKGFTLRVVTNRGERSGCVLKGRKNTRVPSLYFCIYVTKKVSRPIPISRLYASYN
jgi:hypothetical protein